MFGIVFSIIVVGYLLIQLVVLLVLLVMQPKANTEKEIQVSNVTVDDLPENAKLEPIEDLRLLSYISKTIPGLAKGVEVGGQLLADSKIFHKATIPAPSGGFQMIGKLNSVIAIAAVIVGQYYMNEIRHDVCNVSITLNEISSFQENEFKGRVMALLASLETMTEFRMEIVESEENRKNHIARLETMEQSCAEMLGQCGFAIDGYTKSTPSSFTEYQQTTTLLQRWCRYQEGLAATLGNIAELKHALYLGAMSREQALAILPVYESQIVKSRNVLASWHQENAKHLGIDLEKGQRKRTGIDSLIHFVPGLFKKDHRFRDLGEDTLADIKEQSDAKRISLSNNADLFQKDVEILSQNGKFYYLAKGEESSDE